MQQDWETMADNVRIFSGNSHPELAQEIAATMGCRLTPTKTTTFSNDCLFVQLGESVRGKDVVIVQSFTPDVSHHVIELFMMLDAARSASAKSIHAVIPYFAYARSDKKDAPRISITARLMADLLATAGASHILTMTLHSPQVHGFFELPTDHLTAHKAFIAHFRNRDLSNAVVVAPDIGHAKRSAKLARALGVGVAAGDKQRLSDDRVYISDIIGEIRGKDAIVFDDEIATGGSIVELVNKLREKQVRRITLACTHGVFSGPAIERLTAMNDIEEIVTTNTVPIPSEKRLDHMTVLSVGSIFGEAIQCNLLGQSVGQLFAFWSDGAGD